MQHTQTFAEDRKRTEDT